MSLTYDNVRNWDAAAIDTSALGLRGRQDKLIGLQDELNDARNLPGWRGAAGESARNSLGITRNNAEILIAELSAVVKALQKASDEVAALKTRIVNNDSLADTYQFRIAADGAITDVRPPDPPSTSRAESDERAESQRHRQDIMDQLARETQAILTAAGAIDATLARVMQDVQDRRVGDYGATSLYGAAAGGDTEVRVQELEQALRDAGLLTGPPSAGYYRQWLENAVRREVPIDTVIQIAAENQITPEDFAVLDGLEEIREDQDRDGISKSYFLLPDDISAEDAAAAVRLTYIVNAGTDYGAGGYRPDFAPTPYGSAELQRITERQDANYWSYSQNLQLTHEAGGRAVTTPNGMLLALGGNWLQDPFSAGGGTTFGDLFLLNIDGPEGGNAAETLRTVVTSGYQWGEDETGPYNAYRDLDRLLHHEERHSQQWQHDYNYRAAYLGALAGEAAFGIPNQYEVDAGLADGGYEE